MDAVVNTAFPVLLPMLQQLLAAPTGSKEVRTALEHASGACWPLVCCQCMAHGPSTDIQPCPAHVARPVAPSFQCISLLSLHYALAQVPEFIKLICKVYWSSTFMTIPQLLVQQEHFQGWMMAFHTALRKPLPWVRGIRQSHGCADVCLLVVQQQVQLASCWPTPKATVGPVNASCLRANVVLAECRAACAAGFSPSTCFVPAGPAAC